MQAMRWQWQAHMAEWPKRYVHIRMLKDELKTGHGQAQDLR